MAKRKKASRRVSPSKRPAKRTKNAAKLFTLLRTNAEARKKLYNAYGRVRCYLYKYGKSVPSEKTAAGIHKLTRGQINKTAW